MLKKLPVVGVMGSGQTPWTDLAHPLGCALARMNVHLLTGGGAGVMAEISRAFTSVTPRNGLCIGIIPTEETGEHLFVMKDGYPNPHIELPIITPLQTYSGTDPFQISRNYINILTADAVIALPGNGGTRNEIAIAMRFKKPVCLLGPHENPDQNLTCFDKVEDALIWLGQQLNGGEKP